MKNRVERLNQQVHQELSKIIAGDVKDPRLEWVTITHVDLSRDLSHARVYISILGEKEKGQEAMKALKSAVGFIRFKLGEAIRLRSLPELHFFLDNTFETTMKIESLLDKINAQQAETPSEESPEGDSES